MVGLDENVPYTVTRDHEANFKTRISKFDYYDLIFRTLKHHDFKPLKFKSVPELEKNEGYLVKHFKVLIVYEDYSTSSCTREHQYYVKQLDDNLVDSRRVPVAKDSYCKEAFLYNYLLEEYRKLNLDISFAPRFYYCTPYVLYFEDISLRGFKNLPERVSFDLEHCELALNTLAMFHSNSILFERELKRNKRRRLRDKYPQIFRENLSSKEANNAVRLWFKYNLKAIMDVVNVLPEKQFKKGTEYIDQLIKFIDYWNAKFVKLNRKYQSTVIHGDLLSDNILFKYEGGIPVECVLIDYQLLKCGPPALDVLNIIYSNTRRSFRDEYFQYLINYYYDCLCDNLLAHKVDNIVPKDEYLQLCRDFSIVVKCQSICDRCVTFIPKSNTRSNTMLRGDDFRRFLFERKLEGFERFYEKDYFFKTIMLEDMEELWKMLSNNVLCV